MHRLFVLVVGFSLLSLTLGCHTTGVCDCDRDQLPPVVYPHMGYATGAVPAHGGAPAPTVVPTPGPAIVPGYSAGTPARMELVGEPIAKPLPK